jgi:MerR family transcriptional regulator, light-induced transcriptional regulator
MSDTPPLLHSVRVVSRRTGLSPDLLRAWEKRYHAVEPTRTSGGQRNYSDADIARLKLLAQVVAAGRQIGQVAGLADSELRALAASDAPQTAAVDPADANEVVARDFLSDALTAAENFDAPALEASLRTAALRLPSDQVLDRVFGPLLLAIGTRWHEGSFPPAKGHLATAVIRRVLTWMTDFPLVAETAPRIVIGTPAFQMHDLGAMLAATAASSNGWRVTFLGASLPAEELLRAVRMADADAVALSIVHPTDDPRLVTELRALRAGLPPSVALVVGGAGARAYIGVLDEVGAHHLPSIASLRSWLRERVVDGHQGKLATAR